MNQITDAANESERFKDLPEMREAHASLVTQRRQTGTTPDFLAQVAAFVEKGAATGVNLDNLADRKSAQSMLDYWDNVLQREGMADIDPTLVEFDLESQPNLPDELCPYVGLYAFQEDDQSVFYGRQRLVADLVRHMQLHRFLSVVGPSGSGKSSVIRAGLLPELKNTVVSEGKTIHFLPTFVPGSSPLANLANAVQPASAPPGWAAMQASNFLEDDQHLANLLVEYHNGDCVLVIDQFEETFTLCLDEAERLAFAQNLLGMIQDTRANQRLILTLRTDFEPFIQRLSPTFLEAYELSRERVMPLNAVELREAILGPAAKVDLHFEDGIVDGLLQDLLGEPAALPLLQFTLLKLWEKRVRNRVPLKAYEELGGGRLALANSADTFYNKLIPEEQVTMRRILLRMVRPGEGLEVTNNRVQRSTLYQSGEARDRVDRVLDKLVAARLVRISDPESPDAQVEVAHEALIRNWPLLVEWLDEERVVMRQRLRLTTAAEEWDRLQRDPNALWRGAMLADAQSYTDLNQLEEDFVEASLAAEEAARKREIRRYQLFAAVLGVFLFIALIAAGVAIFQRQSAETAKKEALQNAVEAVNARSTADARWEIAATALANQVALLEMARNQVLTPTPTLVGTKTPDPGEEEPTEEVGGESGSDTEETAVPIPTLIVSVENGASQQEIVEVIDVQLDAVKAVQESLNNELITDSQATVLGYSVNGEPIEIVQFGTGSKKIVVVGGIHSGKTPNTVELVEELITYFRNNQRTVSQDATLYFVSNLNPDSPLARDRTSGRFNANGVDLNRNWNCNWTPDPEIGRTVVKGAGGTEPLSEPESLALAEFFRSEGPDAVIFYDAAAAGGLVIPGGCGDISQQTASLVALYAKASGYNEDTIIANIVQGDASNWLNTIGIPAFFVLLPDSSTTDLEANLQGLEAIVNQLTQ
jgi:energy-coupling factor transporter ATP-binding protein EcfA2